jgi:hypothetical protein
MNYTNKETYVNTLLKSLSHNELENFILKGIKLIGAQAGVFLLFLLYHESAWLTKELEFLLLWEM